MAKRIGKTAQKVRSHMLELAVKKLQEVAPPECLEEMEERPHHFQATTKVGLAHISLSVAETSPNIWLYIRFEIPCLAKTSGNFLDVNRYTGKWNHSLPVDDPVYAAVQIERIGALMFPANEAEQAQGEFFRAIGQMLHEKAMREWNAPQRTYLKVLQSCGHEPRHAYCAGCGTDYAGSDERAFWDLVHHFQPDLRPEGVLS